MVKRNSSGNKGGGAGGNKGSGRSTSPDLAGIMSPELRPVGPVHNVGKRGRGINNEGDQELADLAKKALEEAYDKP